jgi:hypothetical protein
MRFCLDTGEEGKNITLETLGFAEKSGIFATEDTPEEPGQKEEFWKS